MFFWYLLIESILVSAIFICTLFAKKGILLDVVRFIPIFCNLLFATFYRVDKRLLLALLFSTIADFFFLFLDNPLFGVLFYIGVQLFYRFYLDQKIDIKLVITWLILLAGAFLFHKLLLPLFLIIYVSLFIKNIASAFKKSKEYRDLRTFIVALLLLFMCDSSIAIKTMFYKKGDIYLLFDIIEWTVYTLSQIALVIYAQKEKEAYAF